MKLSARNMSSSGYLVEQCDARDEPRDSSVGNLNPSYMAPSNSSTNSSVNVTERYSTRYEQFYKERTFRGLN